MSSENSDSLDFVTDGVHSETLTLSRTTLMYQFCVPYGTLFYIRDLSMYQFNVPYDTGAVYATLRANGIIFPFQK